MKTIELNSNNFDETVRRGEPVVVDFWAEWCGPCKMLAPVLEEIAGETAGRATVAKVNIDHEPELARRFGIQSIPTLVIFRDGAEYDRLVGMAPKKRILDQLQLN